MTYIYAYVDSGEEFELSHSIKEPARTEHEGRQVKRLISSESGGFRLVEGPSGGWATTGYALAPHKRQAEAILGKKLTKRAE